MLYSIFLLSLLIFFLKSWHILYILMSTEILSLMMILVFIVKVNLNFATFLYIFCILAMEAAFSFNLVMGLTQKENKNWVNLW